MNAYSYVPQCRSSGRLVTLATLWPSEGKRDTTGPITYGQTLAPSPIWVIVALIALVLAGCAGPMGVSQKKWDQDTSEIRLESLTKESYSKAAALIADLEIGSSPKVTGCKISRWTEHEKVLAMSVACNGWVGPLSGGGWPGRGAFTGVKDGMVYGSHLYGFLYRDSILIPRYDVILQAARIDKAEYDKLRERKERVGRIPFPPADQPELAYWKTPTIKEIRKLDFKEPDLSGTDEITVSGRKAADALAEFGRSFTTRNRFERAQQVLESIPTGADRWEVIQALGGRFYTWDSGESYFLLMDGFLNIGDLRISETTKDGFFKVWPFGYMDQGEVAPRLDLIFRNDRVFKVIPHVSKQELPDHLKVDTQYDPRRAFEGRSSVAKKQRLIKMRHYSFKIPADGNWSIEKVGGPADAVILTKQPEKDPRGRTLIQLKVMTNRITDRQLVALSARENADNVRDIEKAIMLEQGVKPGLYQLHDVSMDEVEMSGRQFYFMDYTTETATDIQPASLYLLFPKERSNEWFIMTHYTEVVPKATGAVQYSKSALIDVLTTLRLED